MNKYLDPLFSDSLKIENPNLFPYLPLMQNNPHIKPGVGIRSTSDYSGFGVLLDGRTSESEGYRNGYQGSEIDNEVKGEGNSYTTHFRQLDPRLGRWWSIDPKSTAYESPYVSMGNNPIAYNDINGDSIPTRFLDVKGKKLGDVPSEFQAMMIKEYGLEVGYNSKTEMLYLIKDHGNVEGGSSTARDMLKSNLTSTLTGRKAKKAHGNLVVGYKLRAEYDFGNYGVRYGEHESGIGKKSQFRTSYLDLDDFEKSQQSGEFIPKGASFVNVDHQVLNMARLFEHEYLGHGQLGLKDGNQFKPGKNVSFVNSLRNEMGLNLRLNYGYQESGKPLIILVGEKEVNRKSINKMLKNLDNVPHISVDSPSTVYEIR
jgi:RHS repeat-associated protein